MYDDVAILTQKVYSTTTTDEYGDPVVSEVTSQVFVGVKSVNRNEFYPAQTAGFDPQIVFMLSDYMDYNNQSYIRHNGVLYKVIRTYRKGIELEIVCAHVDEDGS